MSPNRSSDVYLFLAAGIGGIFLVAVGLAGFVIVRQRAATQVVATATAVPIATAPPTVAVAPIGCVTPTPTLTVPVVSTATAAATATATSAPKATTSPKPPAVRMGATTVNGRLPPEVIQRIVRQNYGRFRLCYENGLKTDPSLQGKVAVKFVIASDGSVSTASEDPSTTLPDKTVVSCVVRGFSGLSFPAPEGGGIVTVVYPVIFSPGE